MFKPLKRPNCRFIAGDAAYIGKTGLIVDKIDKHFRIILDQPQGDISEGRWLPREVELIRPPKGWVAPVGFEAAMSAMPPIPASRQGAKPAAESASDAPMIEPRTGTRLQEVEAVLAESAQPEGEQALPEGQPGELEGLDLDQYLAEREAAGGAPDGQQEQADTMVLATTLAAVGGKGGKKRKGRKDGKPKALSAKQLAQQAAGVKVTGDKPARHRTRRSCYSFCCPCGFRRSSDEAMGSPPGDGCWRHTGASGRRVFGAAADVRHARALRQGTEGNAVVPDARA
jgi:hypothetical protein